LVGVCRCVFRHLHIIEKRGRFTTKGAKGQKTQIGMRLKVFPYSQLFCVFCPFAPFVVNLALNCAHPSHNSILIPPTGTYFIEKPDATLRLIEDILQQVAGRRIAVLLADLYRRPLHLGQMAVILE
jgi:hypothetical protein